MNYSASPQGCVHIVDDDAAVREALGWLLRTRRLLSSAYPSAEAFWDCAQSWAEPTEAACLLLDLRLPGQSGLALYERLPALVGCAAMPVIFLSGHADVATAVEAVKRGAFDFCEKPFSDNALVDRVEQALRHSGQLLAQRREAQRRQSLVGSLTERERAVMRLIAAGLPNKLVAEQLHISVRTVEVHRAHVFDKLGVRSAVDLVHLLRDL
ncbi:MAG: LuxR C-terminal-related transcriptional regulator [Betaproteobacteria bacterium]|uniref:Response regulator n=1 Tax=Serpentinimonas maccroryi TaxID=1458426 RepID=A0A060NPK3_9BURK|nr:LuxR C-terminal-related transcriptional regulator [Serpentinimonas maccroryi]MCL5967794.1 LuxR C-terminal-related transcriptional regulator [Betaproteobacteria bacterium]MCM2478882.1 response regulator transcription factor [Serpentinimonas maccroryi]OYX59327.1 MAG: DNA-binding response regulator [Comamonadaceae bacterium 32-67-11]BAO84501.1 response regulator [Serpentinimonas maccroryi]